MAQKREVVVGSIMGSPSLLVSEEGAAIEVVETKLTGRLRKALTIGVSSIGSPRPSNGRRVDAGRGRA